MNDLPCPYSVSSRCGRAAPPPARCVTPYSWPVRRSLIRKKLRVPRALISRHSPRTWGFSLDLCCF